MVQSTISAASDGKLNIVVTRATARVAIIIAGVPGEDVPMIKGDRWTTPSFLAESRNCNIMNK